MTELDTTPARDDLPTETPPPTPDGSDESITESEPRERGAEPDAAEPFGGEVGFAADGRSEQAADATAGPAAEHAPDLEPAIPTESPKPAVDAGPRSVGRYIADQLRAAGGRYGVTVPGESFLGLLDALEGAGIRVVATRHEGAAAFMAEAHGQLTGRPAAC